MTQFIIVFLIVIVTFSLMLGALHFSKYKKRDKSSCCGQCGPGTCEKGYETHHVK